MVRLDDAVELAMRHYAIEPSITKIVHYSGDGEAIKLLIVNEYATAEGVVPLHFVTVPDNGIPFPVVIIEVTPEEFQQIEARILRLPDGWNSPQELPRSRW